MSEFEREQQFTKIYNDYLDLLIEFEKDAQLKSELIKTKSRVLSQGIYMLELHVWTYHRTPSN